MRGALALLLVLSACGARGGSDIKYTTAKAERGKLTARVTATGTLSALVTVQVGSQVSGRVAQINVDFNSPVKKGQVIARIDSQMFQASAEQARANLAVAQGNLIKAKIQAAEAARQAARTATLVGEKLISQAEHETAQANADGQKAQVVAAEAQVQQARASMHQADINVGYTTIVSPINGTVISRTVDVGQTVAASLQAPTLFTIAEDLKKMQVDTAVAEADVGKLKPDMPATFSVDAYPTERFRGVVRQIRNAPQTVQNVVTYDAVIDVDNSDLRLKPGMTANVTFIHAEREDVLKVPNAALRFRPPAEVVGDAGTQARGPRPPAAPPGTPAERAIWVLRGEKPESVTIKAGITDGSVTEVLEGPLKPGDPVIIDSTGGAKPAGPAGGGAFRRGL